jgi:predicted DNA-binding protein
METNITQPTPLAKVQAWVQPELWRRAKAKAALKAQNNSQLVTEAIEAYLENNKDISA